MTPVAAAGRALVQQQPRLPHGPARSHRPNHRAAAPCHRIVCSAEQASTSDQSAAPEEVCPTCKVKRSEMSWGCDGTGRIIGGIGAVPGFRWWPIKAYRPCGKLSEAGIRYRRKGQDIDEVLFGKEL